MVDAMKEIMNIVKGMPELAIWVLAGLLFYKIVIIGSWFGIARLIIMKGYDAYAKPKAQAPSLKCVEINEFFITREDTHIAFLHLINRVREYRVDKYKYKNLASSSETVKSEELMAQLMGKKSKAQYLHKADVTWVLRAVEAQFEKEMVNEPEA